MDKKKEARENYLRVLYELDEGDGVRSIKIANKLNISKASVSEMLRKLAKEKLVKVKPYSKIFLTRRGKRKAEKLFDKHLTIKRFVKRFLCHDDETAREEAHKLEHVLSEYSIGIIEKIIEENYNGELKPLPSYVG